MADTVGFIGAGRMGEPMVLRLLGAGHEVVLYARRKEVRDRLEAHGALPADSVADVAARSDVLITCLFSDAQLTEVASGADGFMAHAKPDTVVVSHTTGTVRTLTDLASAYPDGPALLDAPVSGSADDIAAGHLTVLLGGDEASAQRARPVLLAYADPLIETGALGSALNLKLVNNVLFAANAQLVAAALQLGEQLGVRGTNLLEALAVCSGGSRAASFVQMTGDLASFAQTSAPYLRKDFAACAAAAQAAGVDLGCLRDVIETGPLPLR